MIIKNVGAMDAGIRAMFGVTVLAASATFTYRPLLALGTGILALALIGTAFFRICPLYTMLGVGTNRRTAPQ